MSQESNKSAKAEMMIRKPVRMVFNAFINPVVTTKFWFTKSSGKLEQGAKIDWIWEMYDLTVPVIVQSIEQDKRIAIVWGEGDHKSKVEWIFKSIAPSKTYITVINNDFLGTKEEVIQKVIDSTGGFTMVLAGLKAWLEHDIQLNLIADKSPTA